MSKVPGRLTDYSLHGWQYLAAPYVYMHRHVTAEKTGVADQIAHWALTFFEALPGLNFIVALIDAALGRKAVTALPSESVDNPVEEQRSSPTGTITDSTSESGDNPVEEQRSSPTAPVSTADDTVGSASNVSSRKEDPAGPPASDPKQLPQDEGAAISQMFRMRSRKHRRVHYQHLAQAIQHARVQQVPALPTKDPSTFQVPVLPDKDPEVLRNPPTGPNLVEGGQPSPTATAIPDPDPSERKNQSTPAEAPKPTGDLSASQVLVLSDAEQCWSDHSALFSALGQREEVLGVLRELGADRVRSNALKDLEVLRNLPIDLAGRGQREKAVFRDLILCALFPLISEDARTTFAPVTLTAICQLAKGEMDLQDFPDEPTYSRLPVVQRMLHLSLIPLPAAVREEARGSALFATLQALAPEAMIRIVLACVPHLGQQHLDTCVAATYNMFLFSQGAHLGTLVPLARALLRSTEMERSLSELETQMDHHLVREEGRLVQCVTQWSALMEQIAAHRNRGSAASLRPTIGEGRGLYYVSMLWNLRGRQVPVAPGPLFGVLRTDLFMDAFESIRMHWGNRDMGRFWQQLWACGALPFSREQGSASHASLMRAIIREGRREFVVDDPLGGQQTVYKMEEMERYLSGQGLLNLGLLPPPSEGNGTGELLTFSCMDE